MGTAGAQRISRPSEVTMSLLLLFQNIRILLTQRTLMVHFVGSTNAVDQVAGGDNQVEFIGSVNELDVL